MRYIVSGGAGFIGSNLADTLAQHHDVVIIDNLATGRRVNIEHLRDHPRVTFIEGSITDLDEVTILSSRLLHLFLWQRQPLSGIIEIFS